MFSMTCSRCQGSGQSVSEKDHCRTCGGSGQQQVERRVKVRVPPGVDTGTRMRVSGEGEVGGRGGPPGDLYVVLVVEPHNEFQREGADLHRELVINVSTAALGGSVEVPLLSGERHTVKIPAGVQPNQRVRIPRRGMPHLNGSGRGDLYAHIQVQIPTKLSKEQTKLFKALSEIEQ